MKQVKFNLEIRKKEGEVVSKNVPVRLSFHFNGKRLEYYTGVRLTNAHNFNKDYWKTGKQVIKANEPEAARKNQRLKDLRVKAELVHDNFIALGQQPTPSQIKSELDKHFKGKTATGSSMLVKDAFNEFLAYVKGRHTESTLKKHRTTYNHLASIFKSDWDKLTCAAIDISFGNRFKEGLIKKGFEQQQSSREYLLNTVVKYLHSLREFLNWCKGAGREYFSGRVEFRDKERDGNVIYLNADEIDKLAAHEMPNETLKRVKDVFLFGCYTAMRHSDLHNLKKSDVFDDYIRFYIKKNGDTTWHNVPLVQGSKEILKKYQYMPGDAALPVLSNQKMNDYLKEVMKLAGFNEIMTIKQVMADGTVVEKQYKKWELMSCHASRKSFICFAINKGVEETVIKAITGHSKNSRAFSRYYEVENKTKQVAMDKMFSKNEAVLKAV